LLRLFATPNDTMDIDPIEDESPTQGLASPIELDPLDEGSLDLGSALEEALNTALSHGGSQRTASPVTPEEESPEGTLSPTTPRARRMSAAPGPAPAPAPNSLVGLTGDQLAELIAQIATRTEQRPRVQQPSHFEGERTKLRIFLVQLGIYFDALGWNEDQYYKKITYAKSLLRGPAGQWLVPYVEGRLEENWETWGQFVETLKLHFGDVDAKETARNKITGITQSGRTMTEYANEFRIIAAETEYDEGTLTRLIVGGMSKKLQDAWEAGETDDLNITLDINRWAIAKENKHSMMDHIRKGRPTGKFDTTPRNVNGTFRPTPVGENRGDPMELEATRRRPGFNISAKEYQRRMRANLCLKCAKPGYRAAACRSQCNKHIPDGLSLNGERLIVVRIVIVDYLHSLVGGSLIAMRPEGTKSNR